MLTQATAVIQLTTVRVCVECGRCPPIRAGVGTQQQPVSWTIHVLSMLCGGLLMLLNVLEMPKSAVKECEKSCCRFSRLNKSL